MSSFLENILNTKCSETNEKWKLGAIVRQLADINYYTQY